MNIKALRLLVLAALCLSCTKETPPLPVATVPSASAPSSLPAPTPTWNAATAASFKAANGHCSHRPESEKNVVRSHDGQARAWTERVPNSSQDPDLGKSWICFERDDKPRILLASRDSKPGAGFEDDLQELSKLVFSRDDRVIFFSATSFGEEDTAHGIEVATGKEWFILVGAILEELDHGPFKGNLLATHIRVDPNPPRRTVVATVIDWKGHTLKTLPENTANRMKVLDGN